MKTYLGDGVYAEMEEHMIKLTTEREHGIHVIYLERDVYAALIAFALQAWGGGQ